MFDPGVDRPLHVVSREDAERHFRLFVESIPARLEMLSSLCAHDGLALDFTAASLKGLDDWLPRQIDRVQDGGPPAPTPESLSICNDVGMYLGEYVIKIADGVRWVLSTHRKSDVYYQRPVLQGFKGAKNRFYSVDFDYVLCQYAFRLTEGGEREPGLIPDLVEFPLRHL